MAITPVAAWSALQVSNPHGGSVGAIPGGSNRTLKVYVWWEQTTNPNATATVGGQSVTLRGHTIPNASGVDCFIFDETKIAAMANGTISVSGGAATYSGNVGWAFRFFTATNAVTANAQAYGTVAAAATVTVNAPSPPAADYISMGGVLQVSSLTFGALSTGYTERLDTSPGGMRAGLADASSRGAESPTWTISSANDIKVLSMGLVEAASAGVSITSVDGDNIVTANQTNVVIVGTGFGAAHTGSARVDIVDGTTVVEVANYDSWSATSIQVDLQLGASRYGSRLLRVTNSSGQSNTLAITVNPPTGTVAIDTAQLRVLDFDLRNKPSRLYDTPTDIPDGAQVELTRSGGSGTLQYATDGWAKWPLTATQLTYRWNVGAGWTSLYTWDLTGTIPQFAGPPIANETFAQNVAISSRSYASRFSDEDGGAGTYSLVPAITGLSFDASGNLTGTPTVIASNNGIVMRYTDPEGYAADSPAFNWPVAAPPVKPTLIGIISDEPLVVVNVPITPKDCASVFVGASSYAVTPDPPAPGITINSGTGFLSGIPTVAGIYSGIVVTATNASGSTDSNAFLLQYAAAAPVAPTFNGFIEGVLAPVSSGPYIYDVSIYFTGTGTYSLTAPLPTGLLFDSTTARFTLDLGVEFAWAGQVVKTNINGEVSSNAFLLEIDNLFAPFPMPDVVGEVLSAGLAILQADELQVDANDVQMEYSATVAAGIILSQSPLPAVMVLSDVRVSISVSLGPWPIRPGSSTSRAKRIANTYQ